MAFDLHITFGGMCLLVRDYQMERLCVLLPPVPPEMGHPHTSTLHVKVGGEVKCVSLAGLHLDLSPLPTDDGLAFNFPLNLVDLDYVTREAVARDLLGDLTSGSVLSTITLAAGSCGGVSRGARWCLGSRPPRFMATTVEWVIRSVDRAAVDGLAEYTRCDASELIKTIESNHTPALHVGIFNTPKHDKPSELPPINRPLDRPAPGVEIRHFDAFYGLYKDPAGRPTPKFKDLGEQSRSKLYLPTEIYGVDYTCVAATATAEERS